MDLHTQNIQQTTSSGRPVLSKPYQRLTPDPKIISKSNIKDQGKFSTTQAVHLICHSMHELPHQLLTTWYLSLCDLDNQWSSEISITTYASILNTQQTSVHSLSQMYEFNFISFCHTISFKKWSTIFKSLFDLKK